MFPAYCGPATRQAPRLPLSPATNVSRLVEGKFGGGTLGSLYLNLGRLEEARKWFQNHVPDSPFHQYLLAWCSYLEDDPSRAVEYLRHALAAEGDDLPTTSRHMAQLLLATIGPLEEAEEMVTRITFKYS